MKYDYQREQRSFAFSERQTRSRTPSCFGTRRPQITLLFRANLPTPLMKTKKAVAGALDCSSLGKDPESQVTAHTFSFFASVRFSFEGKGPKQGPYSGAETAKLFAWPELAANRQKP